METPDRLVIDLDPGEGVEFDAVKTAALQLRRSFEAIGLVSFALLTGGKGVHVVVPIAPEQPWAKVREFAKSFCTALAEAAPERFTVALPKAQRRGRIFLDFLRNQRTATAIMPYSARARDGTPVARRSRGRSLAQSSSPTISRLATSSACSSALEVPRYARWGVADQALPAFG